ncbi:hypothetical protein D3C87_1767860 [compost metagenome]
MKPSKYTLLSFSCFPHGNVSGAVQIAQHPLNLQHAALAGIGYQLGVAGQVASLHLRLEAFPAAAADSQHFLVNQQLDLAVVEVQLDDVAVLDKGDRSAFRSLRRDMPNADAA